MSAAGCHCFDLCCSHIDRCYSDVVELDIIVGFSAIFVVVAVVIDVVIDVVFAFVISAVALVCSHI